MVWPMLVPLLVSVGSTVLSGMSQSKTAQIQEDAKNEFARFRNKQIMTETARQVGELNRQRTVVSMQVNQALASTGAQAEAAQSDMNVAFAMSDSIGNTSQVLLSDVDRQESEAKAVTLQNYETEQFNMNSQLTSLINTGISNYAGITTGSAALVDMQTKANVISQVGNSFASAYSQGLFGGGAGKPASTTAYSPGSFSGSASMPTGYRS